MTDLPQDPIARFHEAYARAQAHEPGGTDASRGALATSDADGRLSVRYVLFKDLDDEGFVFYTNYGSRKARDLAAHPRAAIAWHWWSTGEQVSVEGTVEKVSPERSDAYFASRPRGSQIGAWASDQSRPIESRDALVARVREAEARFEGRDVPRPPHWGGYLLRPDRIEFWHDGEFRLHDRFLYTRGPDGRWTARRLSP